MNINWKCIYLKSNNTCGRYNDSYILGIPTCNWLTARIDKTVICCAHYKKIKILYKLNKNISINDNSTSRN